MRPLVLAVICCFVYATLGAQYAPNNHYGYGGITLTTPRPIWGPVLPHIPMGGYAPGNRLRPMIPRKPQAPRNPTDLTAYAQWPQIAKHRLNFAEKKPRRPQMPRSPQVSMVGPMNFRPSQNTQISTVFRRLPQTVHNSPLSVITHQWPLTAKNPRVPITLPRRPHMPRFPRVPVLFGQRPYMLPDVAFGVLAPARPQMPWNPRVPAIIPRRPQMHTYPIRPVIRAPERPAYFPTTPNQPWYQPRRPLPPAPYPPRRIPVAYDMQSVAPHFNDIPVSIPRNRPPMPANTLSYDPTGFRQQSFRYNPLLPNRTPFSSASKGRSSRFQISLVDQALTKRPPAFPAPALYESASITGNTRPRVHIAFDGDDEAPREDPTTEAPPNEQDNNGDEGRQNKTVTLRRPRPPVLQKRTSFIPVEDCEGSMSCRSVYQCALLGGQPTHIACGSFPTFYCCEIYVSFEVVHNSSAQIVSDPECGWSRERTSRIVGGYDAGYGEYPWQAFIRVGESRCGGALVSRQHVVTAAHCINGKSNDMVEVLLGELVLGSAVEELPHERRRVGRMVTHPKYKDLSIDSHDVAVLVLDRPVKFRSNILPICLPEPNEDFKGAMATVSGWGRILSNDDLKAIHLQAVQVPVIDNALCRRWLRRRNKYAGVFTDHVCAGYEEGGRDSCRGDSGGPLAYKKNGRWYLIGLVSAGYGCSEPMQPGIYHRVSSSSEWISRHVFGKAALTQNNDTHAST